MNFFVDVDSMNQGLNFGLNEGLTLSNFKGEEGTYGHQLNVQLSLNGRMVTQQWYSPDTREITETYVRKEHGGAPGEKTSNPEHPSMKLEAEERFNRFAATLTHVLGVVIPPIEDRRMFLSNHSTFEGILDAVNKLPIQEEISAGNVKVDVFLEYPYNKSKKYTGVGLPTLVTSGRFISRHVEGSNLREVNSGGELTIVNDNGDKVFFRNAKYMSSENAKPANAETNTQAQGLEFNIG